MAGRAGAALGSDSLAAPGRGPSVTRYVVHSGDTLWSAAHHLAPGADPREVVDALIDARGDGAADARRSAALAALSRDARP